MKKININIDGWSSRGKSTLAKQLAKDLGNVYIYYPHTGNTTGMIVYSGNFLFENTTSYKYFFFVKVGCPGFINRSGDMQYLV